MFHLYFFEKKIAKHKALEAAAKDIEKDIKEHLSQIIEKKDLLQKRYGNGTNEASDAYCSILLSGSMAWDTENPNLSNEEFASLLHSGGTLDLLSAYISKKQLVIQSFINRDLNGILQKIEDLAFYSFFNKHQIWIGEFSHVLLNIKPMIQNLTFDTLKSFEIFLPSEGQRHVAIPNFQPDLVGLKDEYNRLSAFDKSWATLMNQRNLVAESLNRDSQILDQRKCPLCGNTYVDVDGLIEKVNETTTLQKDVSRSLKYALVNRIAEFRQMLIEKILNPFEEFYYSKGLTPDIVAKYKDLEITQKKNFKKLVDTYKVLFPNDETIENFEKKLKAKIEGLICIIPEDEDYEDLERIHQSFGSQLKEDIKHEHIKQKRFYLIDLWNNRLSEQIKSFDNEIFVLNEKKGNATKWLKMLHRHEKT